MPCPSIMVWWLPHQLLHPSSCLVGIHLYQHHGWRYGTTELWFPDEAVVLKGQYNSPWGRGAEQVQSGLQPCGLDAYPRKEGFQGHFLNPHELNSFLPFPGSNPWYRESTGTVQECPGADFTALGVLGWLEDMATCKLAPTLRGLRL